MRIRKRIDDMDGRYRWTRWEKRWGVEPSRRSEGPTDGVDEKKGT